MRAATIKELERIRKEGGGILRPPAVVEAARDPKNPLHDEFQWDDTEAAHQYRLWQARELIVKVRVVLSDSAPGAIQAFVSLASDRQEGGYRHIVDVMRDDDMREQLIRSALADLNRWRRKYKAVSDLEPLFASIDSFRRMRYVVTPE